MNENILDEAQFEKSNLRRRDLLPTWIKFFTWIFLIFGAIMPVALIIGILGNDFNLSLYGIETMQPVSLIGLLIILLFAIKGVVAFGLWTEREWAVKSAFVDAVIGIIVCVGVMVFPSVFGIIDSGMNMNIRLELIALIPYLLKMRNIQEEWSERIKLN